MTRFGRRAFLGSSAGLAAGTLAGGGAVSATSSRAGGGVWGWSARGHGGVEGALEAQRATLGPLRAEGLTVNGLVDPVGVDPDGCFFAWTLRARGRQVQQSGWHIVVRRVDPGHAGVAWDSGPVLTAQQAFLAYGGPPLAADAAYEWTVQPRGSAERWGAVSATARFTTGLRGTDWGAATWLVPADGPEGPDRVTYVRSEVTPPTGTLRRATAYISAAHTYRLYLDGTVVDAWPSFSYPDEQYVRAVDLTSALRPGRTSAVGVLHRWYGPGQGRPASSPGLLFLLSMWYADGSRTVHVSDGTWRQHPAEWLPSPQRNSDVGDFVEWVDGRAHPDGWAEPGFDDGAWSRVPIAGFAGTAPFTATYAQRTSIREASVSPIALHTTPSGAVVADFGAVYAARPQVEFARGEAGLTVTVRAGYELDPDGSVSTLHGTQETNMTSTYVMREGPQTFEVFTYLGFRYLQVEGAAQNLGRDQVVARARHAAMPDSAAAFNTDNRMLNAVWRLMARSCLYCSQEQFVDTPTREKGQFLWDAANESEAVMRAWGDQNMSWQGLRDVARGQRRYWPDGRTNAVYPNGDGARFFGTFTARYPEWVWRYYLSTGDKPTALAHAPAVAKAAEWLWSARQPSTGLLYGLADGSNGDPVYGYDLSVAADTASNVLAVNAFNRVSQLAALAGDQGSAALWQTRSAQLTAAVNAVLRRGDGTYVDGVDADGAPSGHASQEANALPLAYGLVPAGSVAAVGAYVARLGIDVGPNHGLELLRALAVADMPAAVVHTLTDASVPGWAHIVAAGGTFTWEVWRPSDLIGDSMSHGWGSSGLVAMQETLLGASFLEPNPDGTVRLVVAPPADGLRSATGTVPTVAGMASVSWQRHGHGVALDLEVPANASALVRLPGSDPSSLREGGVPAGRSPGVTVLAPAGGRAVVSVGSGSYRLTTT